MTPRLLRVARKPVRNSPKSLQEASYLPWSVQEAVSELVRQVTCSPGKRMEAGRVSGG